MARKETSSLSYDDREKLEEAIREVKACEAVILALDNSDGIGTIVYEHELCYTIMKVLDDAIHILEGIDETSSRVPHDAGVDLPEYHGDDAVE